ncbi:MAG: hypothetical protein R3C45_15765 [Phycisphaerales bacterium]
MLPPLKHRLVIGITLVIGGLCWLLALSSLRAVDGSTGLSLMDARVGTASAVLIVVIAGLPACIAGLLSASTGNPLTGAFTVAGALIPLTTIGGSITGYFQRAALPGVFKPLAVESVIWLVYMAVVLVVIDRLRKRVRPCLSGLAVRQHLGTGTGLTLPNVNALLAGLVATAGGAFVCNLLLQSPDGGQVNCGLVIGFAVSALVAQTALPQHNPVVILLSPMVVAIGAYLWVGSSYTTPDALLADIYSGDLPKLALALPMQYASSGVAGCAIGVGLAQTMEHARRTTAITVV